MPLISQCGTKFLKPDFGQTKWFWEVGPGYRTSAYESSLTALWSAMPYPCVRWKGPTVRKKTRQLWEGCCAVYDVVWFTTFQACPLPLWLPLSSCVIVSPLRVPLWVFHSPHHAPHVPPAEVNHQRPISMVFAVFFTLIEKRYFYNMSIKVEKQKIDQESTLFFNGKDHVTLQKWKILLTI